MKTKEDYIQKWIENALTKTKNINNKAPSSYGLKHICERAIGVYVSNDEMKKAMKRNGFISKASLNEQYNISNNITMVVFKKPLGKQYYVSYADYNNKKATIEI